MSQKEVGIQNKRKARERFQKELKRIRKKVVRLEKECSDLKKTREELRVERDKFKGILSSMSDGLDIIDKNYRIRFQNKMLLDRYGDITGKLCFEEYMGRETPCKFCLIKTAIKTGKTQKIELTAPDGKNYELTSTPFKDIDGKIKVIEIVRDITETKKSEEKIKESEERFRELFDHMSSGVAVYKAVDNGKDFVFKDLNRAGEKIDNVKKRIIIGKSVLKVFPGIKKFGLLDVFKRVWKTGKPEYHPVTLYKDNRIAGWRESYVFKLPSGEIVAVYDDVTQRRIAEEKIEESEKRFRKSIIDAPLPIMIHKENGEVVSVNDAWTEISGYAKKDIPTIEAWTEKAFGKRKNIIKEAIDKLYRMDKRVDEGEFEIRTKSGDKRTLHFSSAPLGKSPDGIRLVISMALDVTERKEREKDYKKLINGMNDTAFVIDFRGKFVEVNDTAAQVLGYSRKELLSMGPADIDSTLGEKDIGLLIKGMKKGEKQVFPTTHRTKSGKIIPVEISSSLVTYRGKPVILSIARNITERKKAEEELRISEEKYRAIFENTGTATIIVEENKIISLVNKEFEELSGFSKDEIEGKKYWPDFVVKEDLKEMLLYHKKRRENSTKAPRNYEFRFVDRNEKIKNIFITVDMIPNTRKSVASLLDITGRKKIMEEVKESEERFQAVIEALPHGVCLHDLDGNILLVNKAACEMTGYTQEEMSNMNVAEIDPGSRTREDREKLWLKFEKGGFARMESIHYHKDGSSFPVEIYISAISFKGSPMILAIVQNITERKEAQKRLRESEERFQTVIENLPDEIFVHGLDGKFILVNKASCEKTGYTEDELLQMEVKDIDHESISRDDRKNIWLKLQKKGGFYRMESTHYRKDGSSYPAEIYFGAVTFKGSPMIIGIAHDISERKKAIEKLKESEERFQKVIENIPHAVSVHDLDGKFILVNESLCRQTGYTRDEFINMTVGDVDPQSLTRDDREKIWLKLQKSGSTPFESNLSRKDGTCYPTEIHLSAITLEGNPVIIAIAQDVSDRKKALEDLQKSEEKYRNLYESMMDAYVNVDMKGNIIEFNKQYLNMLGYNEYEIKEHTYIDLTPEKWHKTEAEIVKEQITKRGYSDVYEKEYIKKDGIIFPVELRAFLIREDNGNPKSIWAIVRDITERKKIEKEFRKIERLESLGILAGGIAHDFNNLLTGILGNLSLAQIKKGEDTEEILEEAKQASIQAKNLTRQLLTFSRGGEPIKGEESIENIIKISAGFNLHGSNVKCVYDFSPDLWKAEVDKSQISQVIDNLVINAKQAMPEGGTIKIRAENFIHHKKSLLQLPRGKYIKITVEDEGMGIPEKHLNRIFDPYFTTKQRGSGLGLAIVYSIIKKHDGLITVESGIGKGTSFVIYLPAVEYDKSSKAEEKSKAKPGLLGKGKILIMDDEETVRNTVEGILRRLGYTVVLTINGEQAIEKYREALDSGKPFDVVILDLTVPGGIGGKEAVEKLLQIDPNIKAIVSSGYSTDPVMARYEEYGFSAVVAKPYDVHELNNALKKVLE